MSFSSIFVDDMLKSVYLTGSTHFIFFLVAVRYPYNKISHTVNSHNQRKTVTFCNILNK